MTPIAYHWDANVITLTNEGVPHMNSHAYLFSFLFRPSYVAHHHWPMLYNIGIPMVHKWWPIKNNILQPAVLYSLHTKTLTHEAT